MAQILPLPKVNFYIRPEHIEDARKPLPGGKERREYLKRARDTVKRIQRIKEDCKK